ncbi:MAG: hypothetical protein ABFR05_07760 [Bacteroidota bacterium]
MKKISLAITLVFSVFMIANVSAQTGVSKAELLRSINSYNELELSNVKAEELSNYNDGFADRVYNIVDSDKSEEDKVTALKGLRESTAKDLTDILGKDVFKDYKKVVKRELRPLKRKSKLFKFII